MSDLPHRTAATRWLSPEALAAYISERVDRLKRLQKAGKLPDPSYHLGPGRPRYDREAVDMLFLGRPSGGIGEAVNRAIQKIEAAGGAGRTRRAPRRHREGVPISGLQAEKAGAARG